MPRRRRTADGLPYRLYEHRGRRTYSIGYKQADGKWAFRFRCPVHDSLQILETRRRAIVRAMEIGTPTDIELRTFGWLCDRWIDHQEQIPATNGAKRKTSTLKENKREIAALKKVFGEVRISDITHAHGVRYLDACALALDEHGNARPRLEKGNKEITLAKTIFAFGKDRGYLGTNPFNEVKKAVVLKPDRREPTNAELDLVTEAGRLMGGPYHIMGICFQAAYICYRRSVEARSLTQDMLREDGILWTDGKTRAGRKPKRVLIEWTPELRGWIDEVLSCKRYKGAGQLYVFGNLSGERYTKGGWKANLTRLMSRAAELAAERGMPFEKFSLQDCRPKAVTDELQENGHDVEPIMLATMHSTPRMIEETYDRKRLRRAEARKSTALQPLPNSKNGISNEKRG